MRSERATAGRAFYQIVQDSKERKVASQMLNCKPEDLLQPQFRYRELLHLESCALWAHKLRQLYPQAILIRDYEFRSSPMAKDIILKQENERDITPDILMILPGNTISAKVVVAFEIECVQKSAKRLRQKLRKYATGTFVDGVVYICDTDRLRDLIEQLYRTQVLQHSLRIKHYGNAFFMFQIDPLPSRDAIPHIAGCNFQTVPLTKWIEFLEASPKNFRRDSQITMSASGC